MTTCSVPSCDREARQKTLVLCQAHYHRYWRDGDVRADVPLLPIKAKSIPVVDYSDGTRLCQSCNKRLPLESFHKDTKAPAGRRKTCKICRVAVETERYNRDPIAAAAKMRAYRKANPETVRLREAAAYELHRQSRIATAIAQAHVRRARMQAAPFERGLTVPKLRAKLGDTCCYCGVTMLFQSFPKGERDPRQATLEHRQPISRGGSHTWENCALCCWRCNISKGAKTEAEFVNS